jgi:hypothetical protein
MSSLPLLSAQIGESLGKFLLQSLSQMVAPALRLIKSVIYLLQEHTMNEILASAFPNIAPMLADYIWIGGGTLGLILLIVIVVLVMRKV